MAAADTNLLLRLIVADDAAQLERAKQAIRDHGPLFIPQIALVEACWVLKSVYGMERTVLEGIVEYLLEGAEFVVERPDQVAAALEVFRASRADFADCLILETARSAEQLPLLSFDKALLKINGTREI